MAQIRTRITAEATEGGGLSTSPLIEVLARSHRIRSGLYAQPAVIGRNCKRKTHIHDLPLLQRTNVILETANHGSTDSNTPAYCSLMRGPRVGGLARDAMRRSGKGVLPTPKLGFVGE